MIFETMPLDSNKLIISLPFGDCNQSVNSTRYRWDNLQRGNVPFVIIQRTFEGEGLFEYEGVSRPVPRDHAFIAIIPEPSIYCFPKTATDPWNFAWVNFYGSFGVALCREFQKTFGPVLPLPGRSTAGAMFLKLVGMAQSRDFLDPHETSAACYGFLMEWARHLTHPLERESDPVETAIALCTSRFREPLGVKELAAAAGLTREHFSRIFAERTGLSPARYLRHLRVDAAREMLRRQESPLKEIALRCGFPSVRSLKRGLG